MYEDWNTEEFFKRFKIICLKCGSDAVLSASLVLRCADLVEGEE